MPYEEKREMLRQNIAGISNLNVPLTKKVYLHLKASVDIYVPGQGTIALLQLFEFSCIIFPLESNSAQF